MRVATTLMVPIITIAVFWLSPPEPSLAAEARLDASVQGPLFSPTDGPLYPGGPALVRAVALSYHGPPAAVLALYVSNLVPRTPASAHSCTAPDPSQLLRFDVEQRGVTRYVGSIADFAETHGDSSDAMALLSPRAGGWYDGDRTIVSLSVTLETSADNNFMGCLVGADIHWVAG